MTRQRPLLRCIWDVFPEICQRSGFHGCLGHNSFTTWASNHLSEPHPLRWYIVGPHLVCWHIVLNYLKQKSWTKNSRQEKGFTKSYKLACTCTECHEVLLRLLASGHLYSGWWSVSPLPPALPPRKCGLMWQSETITANLQAFCSWKTRVSCSSQAHSLIFCPHPPGIHVSARKPFKGDIACSTELPALATVEPWVATSCVGLSFEEWKPWVFNPLARPLPSGRFMARWRFLEITFPRVRVRGQPRLSRRE